MNSYLVKVDGVLRHSYNYSGEDFNKARNAAWKCALNLKGIVTIETRVVKTKVIYDSTEEPY